MARRRCCQGTFRPRVTCLSSLTVQLSSSLVGRRDFGLVIAKHCTVQSTRFFLKAIECYSEALTKFPDSFDLAYNRYTLVNMNLTGES